MLETMRDIETFLWSCKFSLLIDSWIHRQT